MLPGKYDITMYRGSTFDIGIEAKDENDNPVDFLANYINVPTAGLGSARMQIRQAWKKKPKDVLGDPLVELTTVNAKIVVTQFIIQIIIAASETVNYTFGSGTYDLEILTGDAVPVVDKVLYGKVTVKNEKTI